MLGKRVPRYLTHEQVDAIFEALGGERPFQRLEGVIVALLYYTGIRVGELVGLDVDALDREVGTLRVLGKNDDERRVAIPAETWTWIDNWLETHPSKQGALLVDVWEGRRLNADQVRIRFAAVVKRAGLNPRTVTPHTLRHTYATRLIRRQVPVEQLQLLLGHRHISTTMVYAAAEVPNQTRRLVESALARPIRVDRRCSPG